MNGWLNIYKPRGISSAKAVALIKRSFKGVKVGHTGTLDLEAQGILPIALGEATKLTNILINAKKEYEFTIKFGTQTDTADSAGKIIASSDYIPTKEECNLICDKFIGQVSQTPPAYSALKVNGQRAYKLARAGQEVKLRQREIMIYDLKCVAYSAKHSTARYICQCSKGTYIRTLAEDISLALQTVGFVLELERTKVGMFDKARSINISECTNICSTEIVRFLLKKCLRVEAVLDDIPVLEASDTQSQKIRFGQNCQFDQVDDLELLWIRNNGKLVAIGSLQAKHFISSRVFNL